MRAHDNQVTLGFLCGLKNLSSRISIRQPMLDLQVCVRWANSKQSLLRFFAVFQGRRWWSGHYSTYDLNRPLHHMQNYEASTVVTRQ